ncbi:MAG: NAD(P)/FAD-dependent oxidoreductase [Acidimicrobiales bacterium]
MYDVIVVGARCAGASLAMLLARAGHRVALLDRSVFPSDTMSTHFLWQRGAARLHGWGLLGRLEERGCAPIRSITFDVGPVQLCGTGPAVGEISATYCPRRTVLDALLVDAAVDAGADLITGFVVDDLVWSEGRVTGVRGHERNLPASTLSARLVVGADGLHSTVGQRAGSKLYRHHPSLTGVAYSYWSGIGDVGAAFHARTDRLVLTWPTNDELTCIYVGWPADQYRQARHDLQREFHAALALVPGLGERVDAGRRVQRFTSTGDLPNQYRTSAGPGWALVGDAGHHKDPSTGMGMSDAFAAADLLARAINDGFTSKCSMDNALAQYQHDRDALTANGFQLTLGTARLTALSPRLESFYRAAADDSDLTHAIFGVLGGSIPAQDVYGAGNVSSVLAHRIIDNVSS